MLKVNPAVDEVKDTLPVGNKHVGCVTEIVGVVTWAVFQKYKLSQYTIADPLGTPTNLNCVMLFNATVLKLDKAISKLFQPENIGVSVTFCSTKTGVVFTK